MCVFKNGVFYHYEFTLDGRRHRGSTGTANRDEAVREESRQRERLEKSYGQVIEEEGRVQRRKTLQQAADEFLADYKLKHESATFAVYALGHVTNHLGKKLVVEITPTVVKRYQTERLAEKAGPKTINDEIQLLLRLCGDQGELIRSRLKRQKALKLKVGPSPGKPFSVDEQDRLLEEARQSTEAARIACERRARGEKPLKGQKQGGSPSIYPALVLALNCGMRDSEIKNLRWSQIDWEKKILTVGRSKTEAGAGRTIPLNGAVLTALMDHTRWYARQFGEAKADWFVLPGGGRWPKDPTVPITSLKTAWKKVRERAGVTGRWHDSRHTLVTELAESGAGDETIMAIAGHVSRQMLSHTLTSGPRPSGGRWKTSTGGGWPRGRSRWRTARRRLAARRRLRLRSSREVREAPCPMLFRRAARPPQGSHGDSHNRRASPDTSHAPCCRVIPMSGWRRSGALLMRSPRASVRRTRSARTKRGGSRLRWLLKRWWLSNCTVGRRGSPESVSL